MRWWRTGETPARSPGYLVGEGEDRRLEWLAVPGLALFLIGLFAQWPEQPEWLRLARWLALGLGLVLALLVVPLVQASQSRRLFSVRDGYEMMRTHPPVSEQIVDVLVVRGRWPPETFVLPREVVERHRLPNGLAHHWQRLQGGARVVAMGGVGQAEWYRVDLRGIPGGRGEATGTDGG